MKITERECQVTVAKELLLRANVEEGQVYAETEHDTLA